jgi:hypothetical protein
MQGNISVEQAISKGKRMLVLTPILIMFVTIGIGIYLTANHYFDGMEWMVMLFFLAGFLLAYLYWSFTVVSWRIWAFTNVRNVHHLKKAAIRNKLIWKDGSFFGKTEIKSATQKDELKRLEKKFLEPDIYHDDLSVPKETRIFYSKASIISGIAFAGLGCAYSIYFLSVGNQNWVAYTGFALAAFFVFTVVKKMRTKDPLVVINASGIRIKDGDFMPWENIEDTDIEVRQAGKYVHHYLIVIHHYGKTEIMIDTLDTNITKLEKLLQVYHLRFEKSQV